MDGFLKKLYQSIIFFQIVLFLFFLIENISNLDEVSFDMVINGTTETVEINFYTVLVVLGAFFVLIIMAGVNLFGIGLNEEGTKNVAKYLSLIGTMTILTIASSYYILQLGYVGIIIDIGFIIVYLFYTLESMQTSE